MLKQWEDTQQLEVEALEQQLQQANSDPPVVCTPNAIHSLTHKPASYALPPWSSITCTHTLSPLSLILCLAVSMGVHEGLTAV